METGAAGRLVFIFSFPLHFTEDGLDVDEELADQTVEPKKNS